MDRYDDREVVSNILAHRDYANAYTAQFVIERDKLYTKNSNLPHGHGELGSGMRNTNKYTKLYSGGVPKFVEENVFQIEIPISNVPELKVGPTAAEVILEKQKVNNETSFETNKQYCLSFGRLIGENIKFPLHIPLIRVIIPVGTLIPIRDTRMIPEILKTKNN